MRSILIKRNELAAAVRLHSRNPAHLPEPVSEPRTCQRCARAPACAAFHRVLQGGSGVTADGHEAGMVHALEAQSHMTGEQQRFLAHWCARASLSGPAGLRVLVREPSLVVKNGDLYRVAWLERSCPRWSKLPHS